MSNTHTMSGAGPSNNRSGDSGNQPGHRSPEPTMRDLMRMLQQTQVAMQNNQAAVNTRINELERDLRQRPGPRNRARRQANGGNGPPDDDEPSDDGNGDDVPPNNGGRNPNQPRQNGDRPAPEAANTTGTWKTDDVGYFWPDMHDDVSMKHMHNAMYYKDVNIFVDRIRDVALYKGEDLVKVNFQACLRGAAIQWFTTQLNTLEKIAIRTVPLEDGWIPHLLKRFKPNPQQALQKLYGMRYTYADVRSGKTAQAFAEDVIRYCRAAEINNQFNQMSTIWNCLDPNLQQHVPEPEADTVLGTFLETLERKQHLWQNLTSKYDSKKANATSNAGANGNHTGPKYNGPRNSQPQRGAYPGNSNSRWMNNGANQHYSRLFQPNRQFYQPPPQPNRQFYQPHAVGPQYQLQPRQVVAQYPQNRPYQGPQNPVRSPYPNNDNRFLRDRPPMNNATQIQNANAPIRNNTQNYRQAWNQTNAYSAEQPVNAAQGVQSDCWNAESGYSYPDPEAYPAYYTETPALVDNEFPSYHDEPSAGTAETICSDDEEDETSANFTNAYYVDAQHITASADLVVCFHCRKSFESNNKLHQHLPCPCDKPDAEHVYETAPATRLADAIIIKSNTQNLPDGGALRTWRSATALVGLNTTESFEEICLDTGCCWSVGNADFLRTIPNVLIEKSAKPITVNGIGSKHETDLCAKFDLYFPSLLNDSINAVGPSFGRVAVSVYMADITAKLLIGTEVMGREGIVIDIGRQCATIRSCQSMTIPVRCQSKGRTNPIKVYAASRIEISPHSRSKIPVTVKHALPDRDLIFEPRTLADSNLRIYAHLVDNKFSFIEASNLTSEAIVLPGHQCLGTVSDSEFTSYFQLGPKLRN
ncbi:hypothetical protein BDV18DRAFT_159545 [Aspergillus unguis]